MKRRAREPALLPECDRLARGLQTFDVAAQFVIIRLEFLNGSDRVGKNLMRVLFSFSRSVSKPNDSLFTQSIPTQVLPCR